VADKIARSIEAQRVLDSELTKEAFDRLEEEYLKAWRNGRTVEQREDAHRYMTLVDKFRRHFRSVVTTGDIEAKDQKELEGRRSLWRS
jgi:hypothetical protein